MFERKKQIEEVFYKMFMREMTVEDFEKWVYDHFEIESIYGYDFYFGLLWLDYKRKFAREDIEKIIFEKIPFNQFEKRRIINNLYDLKSGNKSLKELLAIIYDDYCNGYIFLRFLGLSYILYGLDEHDEDYYKNKSNTNIEKFHKFEEKLKKEASRLIKFLETEQIKIIGKNEYNDNRNEVDKIESRDVNSMFK